MELKVGFQVGSCLFRCRDAVRPAKPLRNFSDCLVLRNDRCTVGKRDGTINALSTIKEKILKM